MNIASIIGIIGGVTSSIGGIPQIIKMIKTGETEDLSWGMINLWLIGLSFSFSYGILINQIPIIITTTLSMLLTIIMLTLKIYYEILINDRPKILSGYEMV